MSFFSRTSGPIRPGWECRVRRWSGCCWSGTLPELELLVLVLVWLDLFLAASRLMLLSAQLTNTIKSGAACVGIQWAGGTFDKQNWPFLDVLEHFDNLRQALVVPDELLLQ